MTQKNIGYSGENGKQLGYVSKEIQKGLDRMQDQIQKSEKTLRKSTNHGAI